MLSVGNHPSGFSRLAAFQVTEPKFSIYRGFAYLHSRPLPELQDELTELETDLDNHDWDDLDEGQDRPKYRSNHPAYVGMAEVGVRTRATVMMDIMTRPLEYGKCTSWQ